MPDRYDLNSLSHQHFDELRLIIDELSDGMQALEHVGPAVSIFGSARATPCSPVYAQAEAVARGIVQQGYAVITGGGPGIMEAANKGAAEANGKSVGINVWLPFEQGANAYADRPLTLRYFFVRKHLLFSAANAAVFMPGGFGTLDELFELLTLMQTERLRPIPVVLFDSAFWKPISAFISETLVSQGYVSPEDRHAFTLADSVDDVVRAISGSVTSRAA